MLIGGVNLNLNDIGHCWPMHADILRDQNL